VVLCFPVAIHGHLFDGKKMSSNENSKREENIAGDIDG
jgi:hypothetical protein